MTNVLQRFNMEITNPVGSTLPVNIKLFGRQCPKTKTEKVEMMKVPYALVVESLMYAMVCTKLGIEYVVGVVNRFINNPGREHWVAVN